MKTTKILMVGVNIGDDGNVNELIVGRKNPNKPIEIINAFQGLQANELYRKLISKKEKNNA